MNQAVLEKNSTLTSINLDKDNSGIKAMQVLGPTLKKNTTLTLLNLNFKNIEAGSMNSKVLGPANSSRKRSRSSDWDSSSGRSSTGGTGSHSLCYLFVLFVCVEVSLL